MADDGPSAKKARKSKVALITGITGQDGSYLAELLLKKSYEVHGIIRRSSSFNTGRIEDLYQDPHCDTRNLFLHYGDLTDSSNCFEIVTSELYGQVQEVPQRETTPFYPRSPYAVAKQYAYWMIVNYREAYGMHLSNGILFNHESPRRGPTFVTRKVTRAVARIHKGLQQCLYMGNIDAKRDWGHARDYVEMMWMMLQQDEPDDYVVATGETNTVRLFIETAFKVVGVGVAWRGEGVDEVGYDKANPARELVKIDPKYFRPTEVELLIGDPTKAKQKLGWTPKVKMEELCREMVEADIKLVEKGDLTS